MSRKRKLIPVISVGLAALLSVSVAALQNNSNWVAGRTCDWSPIITGEVANGFYDDAHIRSDFYFTDEIKDTITAPLLNYGFTFEHRTTTGTPVSVTDQYSFLPDPTFDKDDDDGDGYYEESEVTCGSCEDIEVDYNYYFASWWSKPRTHTSGAFDSIGQMSLYLFEWQESVSDYYGSLGWVYPPNSASQNLSEEVSSKNVIEQSVVLETTDNNYSIQKQNGKIMKLMRGFESIAAVNEYRNEVQVSYNEILRNDAKRTRIGDETVTDAVVTFCEPISLEYLSSLLSDECVLVNYEAKFTNASGDWMTLCSSRLSLSEIENIAEVLSGDEDLIFCGITSAIFSISPYDDTYETLNNESEIYLVDMSEYIIRTQKNDSSLDVLVSDCYYYLEKYFAE